MKPVLLLALALLQPAGAPDGDLTVRSPRGERLVAIRSEQGYPALSVDQLGQVLSLERVAVPGGGVAVRVLGRQFDFLLGAAWYRSGGVVYGLVGAPYRARDSLFVPLQWAVERLPALEPRIRYDAARARLEEFPEPQHVVIRGPNATPPRGVILPDRPTAGPPARPRMHTIAIDAGHGGVDDGMTGPLSGPRFLKEKDITLAVAREVRTELGRRGFATVMTRDADTLIARDERGGIAGARGAEIFVSIHVNAANPAWRNAASARGFETYVLGEARTEDARRLERMENASVRFETSADRARGDALRTILTDLAQNEHLREATLLADAVNGAITRVHPAQSRGVKQAGLAVLATSYMPAVLIEIGFGSNPTEARWLASAAGQRRVAQAIAEGIERYFVEYDRRVGR